MDHQVALGNFGSPCQFEWKGQVYTLSFLTQAVKAELIRLMKQHALEETKQRIKDFPDDKELFLKQFQAACESGKYAWGSPYHLDLMLTEVGVAFLIRAMLYKHKITDAQMQELLLDTEKMLEIGELLKLIFPKQPAGEDQVKKPVA